MPLVNCPKPGCDWTVDSATVPAGGVVTCPQCGQRFKLAAPVSLDRRGAKPRLMIAGIVLAVVVLAGVMVAVLINRSTPGQPVVLASARFRSEAHNFVFETPGTDWAADPDTRTALGANVSAARRVAPPEAWAALGVKDYGSRVPLDSELRDQMVTTLGRLFLNLPPEPPLEPATWAGKPAQVWKFRGEHRLTGAICAGEAFAMTDKGVGYWFYGWAAERDYAPAALQAVRDGFRLEGGRTNWKPTTGSEVTLRSQAGDFRLTAYEKVWEMVPAPSDGVELELKGVLKDRGKRDFPSRAEVRVWRTAGAGDPPAAAEAQVKKQFTPDPETFGPTTFAELTEPPAGGAPPGPDTPPANPVKRIKVTVGSDDSGQTRKLVAFAAIRVGGDVLVAAGSCPWDEREAWERRLVQLVGSLR